MMSWRGKEKSNPPRAFTAPTGFRDSEQPPLAVGEVINSTYQVRQPIARTESGHVFEAWDMLVERVVALMIAWRDPGVAPLLPQARRIASVRDPIAAQVLAIGNHRGAELCVVERVAGRTVAELCTAPVPGEVLLDILVRTARGLSHAHAAGVTCGEISGETVLVTAGKRVVVGSLTMAQVPSVGAAHAAWAPELLTQQASTEPGAAIAVDVYGLGCLAVELATGRPPYFADTVKAMQFGHVHHRPPLLAELRPDLPVELGDLVAELLDKVPGHRPTAAAAAAQLQAIADRAAATRRIVRALIVDDDPDRVRALWSVLRRAHPRATVDAAQGGAEAMAKLRRDRPDLVVVDTKLAGGMNALELCMYVSGLEDAQGCLVVAIVDDVDSADTGVLLRMGAHHVVARDLELPAALGSLVHQAAATPRFAGGHGRITISG